MKMITWIHISSATPASSLCASNALFRKEILETGYVTIAGMPLSYAARVVTAPAGTSVRLNTVLTIIRIIALHAAAMVMSHARSAMEQEYPRKLSSGRQHGEDDV